MNRDQILSILRQALVFAGGYVVAKGWIDNETMLAVVGAIVTLGSAIWALVTHAGATKQAALNVATGTGTGKEIAAVEKTTGKSVPM